MVLEVDAPHGDALRLGFKQLARHLGRRAEQAKIRGQGIRRAQRNHAQSNIGAHETLDNFVHRAIAAAGQNRIATRIHGLLRMKRRFPGFSGLLGLGLDARFAKNGKSLFNGRLPPRGVLAGCRVVNERHTAHGGFHLGGRFLSRQLIFRDNLLSSQIFTHNG